MGKKYYCSECDGYHYRGNIYKEHLEYKSDPPKEEGGSNNTTTSSSSSSPAPTVSSISLQPQHDDLTPLRNVNLSGGLFTENIMLRLRDSPDELEIGKIDSFLEKDTRENRKTFREERREIFEWCIEKWDEISPKIDDWSPEELFERWLIPLFEQFDHEIEPFTMDPENIEQDSPLGGFEINYQSKGHTNPFFHFIGISQTFEERVESNPKKSPYHQICQRFVNSNPEIRWLFLSNGRMLRLLTKYYHTYSKGYLEFDLENIFANRDIKEFNAMYSLIHKSRITAKPDDHMFLIEEFQKEAVKEGVKVGDNLRDNVHDALELLGDELIQQNSAFLDTALSDGIDLTEYYAELLRIIYRIIFILYAEQRKMLPGAGTLYFEEFSLSALRLLAEKPIKAENNYDLWNKLFLTFKMVGKGDEFLDINAYDGALFDDKNLSIIIENNLRVSNDILLKVIRLLTTTESNNVRQRINFLEIREEEIGAVYESLLDYKPYIDENSHFQLIEGTERKSTGSYYTPKELIDILIRTTLQPLVEERLEKAGDEIKTKENTILDIKVCDPACGGGTFLLSALDYLGKRLAMIQTNSESPAEKNLREARRQVLQHCIYGVDMNPLAVELAKISLWLRAAVKDKPLSFLDNHIKCGNSLIGLGQKQKITEINPKAFNAIRGSKSTGIGQENKKLQNMARDQIRNEIKQRDDSSTKPIMITSFFTEKKTADICSAKFQEIIDMDEEKPQEIRLKKDKYQNLRRNESYQLALDEADIWTSTYFWNLEGSALEDIPSYTIIEQLKEGKSNHRINKVMNKIKWITKENQFFHWYVEFPEVFSSKRGGFDCILTNPPWEVMEFKEQEFFIGKSKEILEAPNQSKRRKLIKSLKEKNTKLWNQYKDSWRKMKKEAEFLKNSQLFDLSAKGKINTHALFLERCWKLINSFGYLGMIAPTGIVMNFYMQDLFRELVEKRAILSLFDFENRKKLFDIDSRFRFSLLTLGGSQISKDLIPMAFYTLNPSEIQETLSLVLQDESNLKKKFRRLPEDHILIPLEQNDFELFNPNTVTCPSFKIKKDSDLLRSIYHQSPIFINKVKENNYWNASFKTTFNVSSDSNLFLTQDQLIDMNCHPLNDKSIGSTWIDKKGKKYLPVYEGRMIWHYNHRLNSMALSSGSQKRKAKSIETNIDQYQNPYHSVTPNYWIAENEFNKKLDEEYNREWFLCFRDVTGATNERTLVSTIIPKSATHDKIPLILVDQNSDLICCLLANLNSLVLDYVVRQKISGTSINFYILEQLPIFPPEKYNAQLRDLISSEVLELVYNAYDLKSFAQDMDYKGKPFIFDIEKRNKIQAKLDAIFALLYDIKRRDLEYILESFNVLKRKEESKFGEFKTKRLVLEAYDKYSTQKELFE